VTNGELAYRAYQNMEKKTGVPLATWPRARADVRYHLRGPAGPAAAHNSSPMWSG
jgi:nitrate reductase alpha subunit